MVSGGHCLLMIKPFGKGVQTSSNSSNSITKKVRVGINKVERWRIKCGFKFPSEKRVVSYRKRDWIIQFKNLWQSKGSIFTLSHYFDQRMSWKELTIQVVY